LKTPWKRNITAPQAAATSLCCRLGSVVERKTCSWW